jgi:hypothetical protein
MVFNVPKRSIGRSKVGSGQMGSYTTSNSLWVNLEGVAVVLVDRWKMVLASTTPSQPNCNGTWTVFWSSCSEYPLSNLWLAVSELLPQEVDPVKVHDQV